MPTTSSAASGSSPSSSPASSAPASSASSARRAAASRRVLRAGLLPALAGGVLPGSEGWRRLLLRPGERPLDELRRVLVSGAKDPLAEALDALPADARLLLAVDQLEELFTACRSEAERAAFADTLARAAADPEGRARRRGRAARRLLRAIRRLPGTRRAAGREPRAGRADAGLGVAACRRAARRPGGAAGGAGAGRRAGRRRGGRAGRAALAVHRPARALAEAAGQRAHPRCLPRVRRRPRRRRAAGRGHLRPRSPTSASRSCARSCCAWSARARATSRCAAALRSPSSTWSATRTSPTCSRRWPTAASSPSARAPSRSPTRRCCANGRACASGSRRTPKGAGFAVTSPRRRPNGTRQGAIRASSTAAPASLPRSTGPPITRSTSTSSSASSSPRAARRPSRRRSGPAHEPAPSRLLAGVAVLLAAAVAGGIFAVIQRGEARDAETAQLAQRLGAQALVEEDLDRLAPARPPGGRDRRLAADPQLPARRPPARARSDRDHARRRRHSPRDRGQPRRQDACGRRFRRALFFDARTYERIGEPLPVTGRAGGTASPTAPMARRSRSAGSGFIRLIDARTREQLAEASSTESSGRL